MYIQLYKYNTTHEEQVNYIIEATGKGINATDGETATSSYWGYTDYIDISSYETIRYRRCQASASKPVCGTAFYDANKQFISGLRAVGSAGSVGYWGDYEQEVPTGAVYARFTTTKTEPYGFYLYGTPIEKVKIEFVGIVDDFTDFWFNRSYSGIGDWELHLSGKSNNIQYVEQANFIKFGDKKAGIISYVDKKRDGENYEVVISGVELKGLAQKRIIIPDNGEAYQHYSNCSPEYVVAQLIDKQIINASENRQIIGQIAAYEESTDRITYNGRFEVVAEEIQKLCETYNIGWYADIENNKIVWHIYHGIDRTAEQSDNNRLIISDKYDNIKATELSQTEHSTNTLLVAGQGEGTDRTIVMINDDNSGFRRTESYIDARDLETTEELQQRGQQKISEVGDQITLEVTPEIGVLVEDYTISYDLGDIGTLLDYDMNIRITQIEEVYENGYMNLNFTFGFNKATASSILKGLVGKTDSVIKKEGYGNGGTSNTHPIYYIEGSDTDTAGVWTGTNQYIHSYTNGLTIIYVPKVTGKSGGDTLNINGLGAIGIYRANSSLVAMESPYPVGTPIIMTYEDEKFIVPDYGDAQQDKDTHDRLDCTYGYFMVGDKPLYRYKLCGLNEKGELIPLVKTNKTNTAVSTTMEANDSWFNPRKLYSYDTTTVVQSGSNAGGAHIFTQRYLANSGLYCNINGSMTTGSSLYYKGTYNRQTGLFKLDDTDYASFFVVVPIGADAADYFEAGYYYIQAGTYSGSYFQLAIDNPMYYYDGTKLVDGYNFVLSGTEEVGATLPDGVIYYQYQ